MAIEKMLGDLIVDVDKVVEQARKAAEQNNEQASKRVAELRELFERITAETDDNELEGLEEEAAELAEELEIEFVYTRYDGKQRTYTPECFWEPSGGCEWVESAYYGSDYGWDIH